MTQSPAEQIVTARVRAGLSQRELAARSGMRQPNIAAYESGRREPSPASLERLLHATRIRPSQALARHRDRVVDLVTAHGGSEPKVFGSAARGTDTTESDLDLIVHFEPGTGLLRVASLVDQIEQLLGVRVDIIEGTATGPTAEIALRDAMPL